MTINEQTLAKVIRALFAYYGPHVLLRAVVVEADQIIEELAVNGDIEAAKEFAELMEAIRAKVSVAQQDRGRE